MNAAQQLKFIIHGNVQVFNTPAGPHAALPYGQEDDVLGEITRLKPEITFNTNRTDKNGRRLPDGIEIRFGTARPTEATREVMKSHGFQFSEKQTLWYARDTERSRSLAEMWADEDVEVDTTQYVKQHFWARVRSRKEYGNLREYSEFFVKANPPKNFYNKKSLEQSQRVDQLIDDGALYFKKFFNRAVDEDDAQDDEAPPDGNTIADRLQALADGMQKTIDEKLNPAIGRMNRTARRNSIAAGIREEGRVLERTQRVLYALARAHRFGSISRFPLLESIRTKSQVSMLNLLERSREQNWREGWAQEMFANRSEDFERIGIESFEDWEAAEEQKKELLLDSTPPGNPNKPHLNEYEIRELEDKVWEMNIPGFFPTPASLIDRMIRLAELEPHHFVLDPSAGKGDILDAVYKVVPKYSQLHACEINNHLVEILLLKHYTVQRHDFLQLQPDRKFDRILMNPPFERGQDADHVTHALKFLSPGGRIVAIVGEGLFFRKNRKEAVFREMLRLRNAYVSEPIEGAFANAFHSTGVRVRIIAINEDGSPFSVRSADWQRSQPGDESEGDYTEAEVSPATEPDEAVLLELEAEAELELLKMRVEQERRKRQRGIDGINIAPARLRQLRRKARAMNDLDVWDFN